MLLQKSLAKPTMRPGPKSKEISLPNIYFLVNRLSSKLTFKITEVDFRQDIVDSVRRILQADIGKGYIYRVLVSFKSDKGWTQPVSMIYDTGAAVTLLPCRFIPTLGITQMAEASLGGVVPGVALKVALTRLRLRIFDHSGNLSPEIGAWVAVAERDDVPLVLGLKDIADKHIFLVEPREGKFYLEFYLLH